MIIKKAPRGSPNSLWQGMFLHIVNVPDGLKVTNEIEKEMLQLEETKKFHLSLYSKEDQSGGGMTDFGDTKEVGLNQHIKGETASSDATKNELLRALDLRLMALREELTASFNHAAGATCSTCQLSNLAAFMEYFDVTDLRNILLNFLAWSPKDLANDPSHEQLIFSHNSRNNIENTTKAISQPSSRTNEVKPVSNLVSPAKIAQAEREWSTDEESSDSNNEDVSHAERSRPVIRSASPRRSASPMRRIQIGRSGSRRSTSLTIKSLNYFPAREKILSIRDSDGSNCGDEEPDQPPKKPENQANPVRRMSVQDAINLFERKQKDEASDAQKRKALGEVSASTTTKSVLRRWSSGMGDSFTQGSHETTLDGALQNKEENNSDKLIVESSNPDESPPVGECSSVEKIPLPQMESHVEPVITKVEEVNERATSAEWSRQKEAELNQMLMKLMESKAAKQRSTNGGGGVPQDVSGEQRGGFYRQYKEKRDEKLRVENSGKKTSREAQQKVMKETLDRSKVEIASKTKLVTGKRESVNQSQKPRRNSAPPMLPKKEVSAPTGTRKVPTKSSPLPATRNSCSSGPLPRVTGTAASKMSPNPRKSQPMPSPTQPSPRTDRPLQQTGVRKRNLADVQPSLKGKSTDVKQSPKCQQEKKHSPVTKSSKNVKTKNTIIPGDDSGGVPAKPSFYNKVTKKGSVVPLESKPFLRKGTGIGPGVGPVVAKIKVSQSDESPKSSGNIIQAEENQSGTISAEPTSKGSETELDLQTNYADENKDLVENVGSCDNSTDLDERSRIEFDNGFKHVELPVSDIQADDDLGISSAAWVEVECQDDSASCDNGQPGQTTSPGLAPSTALSSPRVRHSLSQMLQADSNEPEIIEWGNAENPPALVYQKDAPKGLKRLLKFARKSKGEANVTGWVSPSVFSEGEDDTEESKAASKRSSDALSRKVSLQAKSYEPPKSMLTGSVDGGNSSKGSMDYRGINDILSAQSSTNVSTISDKLRELQSSASSTSSKATRSFFSLSTFRSTKSSETKLR
ncbi:serine/arginine repetitive matrix protein 1-like isoform X2 [Iris pallida]|uniref:Serine/arginine repetitive matrix protein 1-like isoform X2 n=1 Tax=Iris pallida TaxID=29817 RepID=A0AAX6HBM2_IRIPA|nr:serine/arginine repetitive matrix protein 1-like isoform X2 [Iris pallida]